LPYRNELAPIDAGGAHRFSSESIAPHHSASALMERNPYAPPVSAVADPTEPQRGLDQLPIANFTFSAVPPKVKDVGTFPVRTYATLPPHSEPTTPGPT
jgi:hypothetical protein